MRTLETLLSTTSIHPPSSLSLLLFLSFIPLYLSLSLSLSLYVSVSMSHSFSVNICPSVHLSIPASRQPARATTTTTFNLDEYYNLQVNFLSKFCQKRQNQ